METFVQSKFFYVSDLLLYLTSSSLAAGSCLVCEVIYDLDFLTGSIQLLAR